MGTATCMIVFISKKISEAFNNLSTLSQFKSKETYLNLIGWNKSSTIILFAKI